MVMKADRVFSPWADRNRPKQLSVAANSYKRFGNAYASEALGAQCKPARYWAHHERLSWGLSFRTRLILKRLYYYMYLTDHKD